MSADIIRFPMEVRGLGGSYQNQTQRLRWWWDLQAICYWHQTNDGGRQQAALAEQRAESAEQRKARLAERLREMGIDDLV